VTVTQLCVDYIKCGKFPKVVRAETRAPPRQLTPSLHAFNRKTYS